MLASSERKTLLSYPFSLTYHAFTKEATSVSFDYCICLLFLGLKTAVPTFFVLLIDGIDKKEAFASVDAASLITFKSGVPPRNLLHDEEKIPYRKKNSHVRNKAGQQFPLRENSDKQTSRWTKKQ